MPESKHPLIIHFMRHGESIHKGASPCENIRDPDLAEEGLGQCYAFKRLFGVDNLLRITHVLCCPMKRTLHTAIHSFRNRDGASPPIIALPELQNLCDGPTGRGMPVEKLKNIYDGTGKEAKGRPFYPGIIDTSSFMREGWNEKADGIWSPEEVKWRMDYLKGFLNGLWLAGGRGEKRMEVMIITHGSFMREFLEQIHYDDVTPVSGIFDDQGAFELIGTDELKALGGDAAPGKKLCDCA